MVITWTLHQNSLFARPRFRRLGHTYKPNDQEVIAPARTTALDVARTKPNDHASQVHCRKENRGYREANAFGIFGRDGPGHAALPDEEEKTQALADKTFSMATVKYFVSSDALAMDVLHGRAERQH